MMRNLWLVFVVCLAACRTEHLVHTEQPSLPAKSAPSPLRDGAPSKVFPLSFKASTPKIEPLSRYGNPQIYHVDGQTYEVMRSGKGYKKKGIASWYGTKFHKKRTSSGEDYDMYAMTAAHKTLPLPSYVKVRNLNNDREIIVKVNDRGPFHSDRIIDLSYAAAYTLGVLAKGTAPVEIETLMSPAEEAAYYLQAGAFETEKQAKVLQAKIMNLTTYPVFVESRDQHYLVKIGPFLTASNLNQLQRHLAEKGFNGSFSVLG